MANGCGQYIQCYSATILFTGVEISEVCAPRIVPLNQQQEQSQSQDANSHSHTPEDAAGDNVGDVRGGDSIGMVKTTETAQMTTVGESDGESGLAITEAIVAQTDSPCE